MRYPITTYKRSLNRDSVQLTVDVEALSRLREVFLIVMIAVSVLCCIALYDYAPSVNTGVAYAILISFGGLRYVAASLFGYIGITLYLHWNRLSASDTVLIFKLLGIALVFLSLDYIFGKNGQGGLLGNWLVGMLPMDAGIAWVLVITALVSGIFLMTRLSWYQLTTFFYYFCQTFIFFKTKIANRRDRIILSHYDESREVITSGRAEPSLVAPQSQLLLNDPIATQLSSTLQHFGIKSIVSGKETGLAFTRYEVHLAPGLKSSTIVNLRKDIARSLLVHDVKVLEVIPGKACIGIEIPNANRAVCNFSDIQYKLDECNGMGLPILLGKTVTNEIRTADLEAMPHLLVAGRTGSGKTMLLQAILVSLTSVLSPEELQIILIDPKRIAFSAWQNLPHLHTDIITEANDATAILNWCVAEMENRYKKMAENPSENQFPKIVVMIDEFADLRSDTEDAVIRLSRKARQSNIHLIAATQRPTIDVITGQIKANISARIALSVSDKRESRIILDDNGAESLLGHGDMLFKSSDRQCERIHAPYVSDDFINEHVLSLTSQYQEYKTKKSVKCDKEVSGAINHGEKVTPINFDSYRRQDDSLYQEAVSFVKEAGRASISGLQIEFDIGYQRAAKLIKQMEDRGILGKRERYNRPMTVLLDQ